MSERFIRHAVVLAAGKGTRMGKITSEIPKPMLSIQGKPMLQHILERLAMAGIENFFVVVGYRHEMIESHFRDWQPPSGLHPALEFRVQDPVNGTGSAALLAKDFIGNEPFLLTYADILCDPSEYLRCSDILGRNLETAAVLAVKAVDDPWQGAAVYEEDGRIQSIIEKPPKGTSTTHWNGAGFYAFRPILFHYLERLEPSPRNEYELTSALDTMLEDSLELRISPIAGSWRDVGRPEDLAAVNAGF
ncbi:MAG: NTP transferase domain-containing protein [Acidobacteriaceae bacterium]|nr:NTP transferase domain-containing protein [Acidobacteriaceae bacterium]MBV9778928.1 NTP transferase domain-containing protein [Acidobacteriaceae bacterium]